MQTTVVKLLDHTCISTMRYENCLKILQISLVLASVSAVSSINLHIFLNSTFTKYIGYFKFPVKLFRIIQPFFFMYDDWKKNHINISYDLKA